MNTWELALALASHTGTRAIILVPSPDRNHTEEIPEIIRRFKLDRTRTGFLFFGDPVKDSTKSTWPIRDRKIAAIVDLIIPVSIRPGGNLAELIEQNRDKVNDAFIINYDAKTRPRPRYDKSRLNASFPEGNFLVHFTRTTASPWPDETDYDFYLAMATSAKEYCRSARSNLIHILKSETIFGSSKNIRGGYRVVGFTALSNSNLHDLFRYRRRLINPYFEPYGLGISTDTAVKFGMRPVRYGSPENYHDLPAGDKPFFQNVGDGGRWRSEQEWRHPGDFCFAGIPADNLHLYTAYRPECELMLRETDIRITPLLI